MESSLSKDSASTATAGSGYEVFQAPFASVLSKRGYKASTIGVYVATLRRVARLLEREGGCLAMLQRADVPGLLRRLLGKRRDPHYYRTCSSPLHTWLAIQGRCAPVSAVPRWQAWLDDYLQFLANARGLASCTQFAYVGVAQAFMEWQFGKKAARWLQVTAADLWRYGEWCVGAKHHQPSYVNRQFSALRQFFTFLHLRGACSPQLRQAVPKVCNYGHTPSSAVLTEGQRNRLLSSFDLHSVYGRRDHAMALCMIDLGFRAVEVARLRLSDIDWEHHEVAVPAAKASRGRRLPLSARIAEALTQYIENGRPMTDCSQVFMGHRAPSDRPVTTLVVRTAMYRAYQRCGFPASWCGTHRLRRTFATRLYARGVDLKQIADLLGHHHLTTTTRYAQTDLTGLRAVAQPWPQ